MTRLFPILLVPFLALALGGQLAAEGTEAAAPDSALPAISVATVMQATLSDRIIASGLIGPVEEVQVQPQVEGQAIDALLADLGDAVTEGQVLAQLSRSSLDLRKTQLVASRALAVASLAQAEAQLTEARASADEAVRVRDRTQSLRSDGAASQAALEQATASATSATARVASAEQGLAAAQAQIELADAQLADVDLSLSRTSVKAPFAGTISARNASVGAIASAGAQPMFVIVRDGLLELRADVAEGDVLRLAEGQAVTMQAVGLAQPLTGTVRLVEPTVDSVTRLGRVRITLDAPETIKSGMFAEADILVAQRDTLAVPVAAVQTAGTESSVLRVSDDGRVDRVPVVTGIRDSGQIEIVSGLEQGDTIVARAGAFVRDGDRINPVPVSATN